MQIIYSHTALRGLAALSVCFFHLHLQCGKMFELDGPLWRYCFDWADDAVNLFFMLSGFILYWVYCQPSRKVNWSKYYFARAARILPLYYVSILGFLVVPYYSIIKHGYEYVDSSFLLKSLLAISLVSGPTVGPLKEINYPAWSVSVEVMLYVFVFPLCVLFLARKKPSSLSVVLLAALCLSVFVIARTPDISKFINGWQWTWLGRGVAGFVVGFLLAEIYIRRDYKIISSKVIDVILALSIVGFLLVRYYDQYNYGLVIIMPIWVYVCAHDKGFLCRLSKKYIFQWLGDRSYSMYLLHVPIFHVYGWILTRFNDQLNGTIHALIVMGLIMLLSDISFRFFESPIRRKIIGLRTRFV